MRKIASFILPLLLLVAVATALEGGLYNVSMYGGGLAGGNATGENYSASTVLTDSPGFYNATGNGFAANVGMFPVSGLVARPSNASNSSNATNGTTSTTSSSSGGGGGGMLWPKGVNKTEATPVGVVELSDTRQWLNVKANQTVGYKTANNVSITSITLRFTDFSERVKLNVRQYKERPTDAPELAGTYKYLQIEHIGIEDTDVKIVEFAVPIAWVGEQGIAPEDIMLYRLESGKWVSYEAKFGGASSQDYFYTVSLPGFSYFAIASAPGKGSAFAPQPVASNETQPAAQTLDGTAAQTPPAQTAPVEEQPAPTVRETKVESGGISIWLITLIIAVVVGLGLVGVQQYQKHRNLQGTTPIVAAQEVQAMQSSVQPSMQASVAQEQPKDFVPEHDPAAAVHRYIHGMRARGVSDEEIKQKLLSVGWDALVVDMELMRK